MAGIGQEPPAPGAAARRRALAQIGDIAFQDFPVLIINRHGPKPFGHVFSRCHQRGGEYFIIAEDAGAVMAKIAILVLIVLFIQKRPQGLFALKGRSLD